MSPSAPAPRAPRDPLPLRAEGDDLHFDLDTRRYRVRGLQRNLSLARLRVNLLAVRDERVHLDTLDLYQARSRAAFIRAAAAELYLEEAVVKQDVGRLLLALEELQQQRIAAATRVEPAEVELSPAARDEALGLLRDRRLVERILQAYDACGLVGEADNKLLCYLACTSRLLPRPLAVLVQSGSGGGKSSLLDATLALMPPEQTVRFSALTGQSLYYMGGGDLRHKILAIAEEEGVRQASYALKLLQSDGRLRIAAAGKNRGTGRQETETYEVQGPVMMLLTTTSPRPDPELENRCLVLRVSETPEQTAAIQARQREAYTLAGHAARDEQTAVATRCQNAQRLLRRLPVVIPRAGQLGFRSDQTRMRREHANYLSLIAASALLHQHQRPRRTAEPPGDQPPREYVEAAAEDVRLANRLFTAVRGAGLDDLLPQTRQLLVLLDDYVTRAATGGKRPRQQVRFTQREIRESLNWSDYPLRRHLARLVELEYVLVYRTGAGNQREYQLLYDGQGRSGQPFVLGLADPWQLSADHPIAGFEHPGGGIDGDPSGIRAASDDPAMGEENGQDPLGDKDLGRSRSRRAASKVQRG